jgi:hypothetical protein
MQVPGRYRDKALFQTAEPRKVPDVPTLLVFCVGQALIYGAIIILEALAPDGSGEI